MPYFDTMFTLALRLRRVGFRALVRGYYSSREWYNEQTEVMLRVLYEDFGANARTLQARQRDALTLGRSRGFRGLGRPRSDGASVSALTNKAKALSEQNTDGSWKL